MSTDPPPEPEPDDADNRIFFPGPPGSHHCAHWPLRPPDPQPELGEADQFVEVDPTGRYGRYRDVLGKGAFKKVYKAFDELEGIEVAWNQVRVADVLRNSEDMDRLYSEVHLLKTLKHKNIIKFYNSWVDKKRDNSINFITEVFTSGTLSQYRRKHKHVDIRALKNWSRQILSGLQYLHSHDPPVIHRDLKCDNIFVNGNQGEVKIGDLGLAAILRHAHIAHSVIGTPEFMAPELYEEEYNELVDIYAFGMCLLELVTFEYPYSECSTPAQIYKKVMSGVKPASLSKVTDPAVKEFIEKCISNASERLSARALLRDPFLQVESRNGSVGHRSSSDLNFQGNLGCTDPSTSNLFNTETCMNGCPDANTGNLYNTDTCMNGLDFTVEGQRKDNTDTCMIGRDFTVEGQRKDINTIFLKLRIADLTGQFRNIHFPFDIEADTSISVATEMVSELDLTDQDVTAIAEMIDAEIHAHVPEWVRASEDDHGNETTQVNDDIEAADELSSLRNESNPLAGGLVLEQLSSGRKYWSDSPRGTSIDSPRLAHSHLSSELNSHGVDSFSVDFCEKAENLPDDEDHDVYSSHGTSSSNPRESPHFIDCADDNLEVTLSEPLKFRCESFEAIVNHDQSDSGYPRSGDSQRGNDGNPDYSEKELLGNNSESFKYVTKKLKHILVEQQKELDSLRKKHDMSISDVLKELPPELCRTILSMFGLKVPDNIVHSELEVHSGPSTTYSTPEILRSRFTK